MAIPERDHKLLSTFPRPPPGSLVPPPGSGTPSPRPSPSYRASDFGYIQVGLCGGDEDSFYDTAEAKIDTTSFTVTKSAQIASSPSLKDLQLVLDNPSKLYAPLDDITGYITGWDPGSHIHIILEGRAKTYIRTENTEYKDRAPILYHVRHLKPVDQQVIPRFSITIPTKAQSGLERLDIAAPKDRMYGPYWTHDWPAQETYECEPGHPLPPSSTMPLQIDQTLVSRITGLGYIEYKIIVVRSRLDTATQRFIPSASCWVPLQLTTRRLPLTTLTELVSQTNTITQDLKFCTSQLAQLRRASLRDHFRDTFTATPSFHIAPAISIPKISTPGGDLRIIISVNILPPPPGKMYNFPVPDITVSYFSCRIRTYSGLRVLQPHPTNSEKEAQARSHTFKSWELKQMKSSPAAMFKPKDGNFDDQSCIITVTIPKSITPSFKTYNFWRSYRIEVEVTFAAAGKEATANATSDLNIVARPEASVVDSALVKVAGEREEETSSLQMAEAMVERGGLGFDMVDMPSVIAE